MKSGKWINNEKKGISEVYKNVCDVYMCANYLPKRKCRSWVLTKKEVADEVQTNDDEMGTHLSTGTRMAPYTTGGAVSKNMMELMRCSAL